MAKKTTTEKATGKKPMKAVTMAERVRRIERILEEDQADFLVQTRIAIMERLDKIERLLATPQDVTSGTVTFKSIIPEEQGLEAGDYTDASKEVADALTAVVPKWWEDSDSIGHSFIVFTSSEQMLNTPIKGKTHYPQAEFLRRAAVTAKALGLVAVEPWKPEVGKLAVPIPIEQRKATLGSGLDIGLLPILVEQIDQANDGPAVCVSKGGNVVTLHLDCRNFRKPTPQEEAKYHADIEAAKPIVPYVTRVMFAGKEWRVIRSANKNGRYQIHRVDEYETAWSDFVKRSEFTVLP